MYSVFIIKVVKFQPHSVSVELKEQLCFIGAASFCKVLSIHLGTQQNQSANWNFIAINIVLHISTLNKNELHEKENQNITTFA